MVCGSGAARLGQSILEEISATQKKEGDASWSILNAGLLRPVIGEQLRGDHDGGCFSSSKPQNNGILLHQLTLSYY